MSKITDECTGRQPQKAKRVNGLDRDGYRPMRSSPVESGPMTAALSLAESYPVFPCDPKTKRPLTSHGFHDATRDCETITRWWRAYPQALIGVPTGCASGLVVVDCDPKSGDWFERHRGALGAYGLHQTRRGRHLVYRMNGQAIGCSTSEDGIDVRGEGGYVIWWPAHGGVRVGEPGAMPQWLEEEIAEKKAPKGETNRATAGEDWEDERPRLIQLLAQLSPDFSHDEWATVLAVISYVSGGSKDGEDIAVEYSRGKYGSGHSGKFPGEAAVRRKYRSFRNDKRANAGMGTLVELAKGYGATVPKKRARKKYPDGARVELVVAQSVEEKAVRWVWKGFLARNKLHLLAGAGGTMKSTLTLAMAAVITRGGTWPDGTRCERPGNVVIWSGEDDLADTVKPRLRWAGADLSHVFFVQGVREEGQKRDFDPATDMPALERAFVQLGEVTLLIVDPIVTIVQKDNNSPSEVRRSLAPLIGLAWRFDCALLGLQHFTKGSKGADPTERILGSGAWVQAARLVLACARIEDGTGADGRMIFACIKSAYKAYGGFEYGFEEEARTEITRTAWGQAVKGIGSRIITEAEGDAQGGSKLASAKAWLREQLEGGMQSTVAVGLAALKAGFTEITLRRAREALGVRLLRKERKRWWGLREEE